MEKGDGDDTLGFEVVKNQVARCRQRQLPCGGGGRFCDLLSMERRGLAERELVVQIALR